MVSVAISVVILSPVVSLETSIEKPSMTAESVAQTPGMFAMSIAVRIAVTSPPAATLVDIPNLVEFFVFYKIRRRQPHAHPVSLADGNQDNARNAGVKSQIGFS